MIHVKLMGRFADPMPKKYKKQRLKLYTNKLTEVVALLDQFYDFSGELKTYQPEIRIGTSFENSRLITHPSFATAHIPDGVTVYIVPRPEGAIPGLGAALISALISAAITIAVTLLSSILFPPPQNDTGETRKSVMYGGGLNTQKEGVALPYIAGRRVLCGFNVIEADVDVTNTGGTNTWATGGLAGLANAMMNNTQGIHDLRDTVFGSKGGGGRTIPNSVLSNASLRILGATGMGEIEGIVGSTTAEKEQHIYFNETPARDPGSGQLNFQGFAFEERKGVLGQSPVPITPGITTVFNQNVELKASTGPLTYPISAPDVNRVKLLFNFNALMSTDKKGNQSPASVAIGVNVKRLSDANWTAAGLYTVTEKSSDRFQRQFNVEAPAHKPNEVWQIQVYRQTPDSTDDQLQSGTAFGGWTEITDLELAYDGSGEAPATALFGCAIDLAQFNNGSEPPEIAVLLSGTKVRVPINYNEVSRTYSGNWNGAWKYASTDNPVWHFLHIATSPLLCAFPDDFFNKGSLYATAKFCDELVNGRHRFSLNKQFVDEKDAWPFLVELAASFRAWPYFNGQEIILVQDRPQNQPDHYVNNSMVEGGKFSTSLTAIEERFNEVRVEWDNPDDYFRKATAVYREPDAIAANVAKGLSSNGVLSQTYYKVGCTNAQEAYDYARLLCYVSLNEIEQLEFTTLLSAAAYAPGQLIEVDDWTISGKEPHGRISAVPSGSTIKLDNPFTLKADTSYTAHLVVNNQLIIRPIAMVGTDTTTDIITVDSTDCEEGTPVGIVETGGTQPRLFRIIDIKDAGEGKFTVTARQHIEGKYAWVEQNVPIPENQWTKMKSRLPAPTGLRAVGSSYQDPLLGPQHQIEVAWDAFTDPQLRVLGYVLEVQEPGSSQWTELYRGNGTVYTYKGVAAGRYVFSLKAINMLNEGSDVASLAYSFEYGVGSAVYPPIFVGFN